MIEFHPGPGIKDVISLGVSLHQGRITARDSDRAISLVEEWNGKNIGVGRRPMRLMKIEFAQ